MVRLAMELGLLGGLTVGGLLTAGCEGSCEDKLNCGPQAVDTGGGTPTGAGGDGVGGGGGTGGATGGGGSGGGSSVVVGVTAGARHSCAWKSDGTLWCWGDNTMGQLGLGMLGSTNVPAQVTTSGPVVQVSAGRDHTCARFEDDSVWCWGRNDGGQVGIGQASPVELEPRSTGIEATDIAASSVNTCAARPGGEVWCWGEPLAEAGSPILEPELFAALDAQDLAGGDRHMCAMANAVQVYCWGANYANQVVEGGNEYVLQPTLSNNVNNVLALAAGGDTTCAIRAQQDVRCWGSNSHDQWGEPSGGSVVGVANSTRIGVGGYHACANGASALHCWGRNNHGQLGDPGTLAATSPPVMVARLRGVTALAAGELHTCALTDEPSPRTLCWGNNFDGQLGSGTNSDSVQPVEVLVP